MEFPKTYFNITQIGEWPNEKYEIAPKSEYIEPVSKSSIFHFPVYGNPSIDYGPFSNNKDIDYEYEENFQKEFNYDTKKLDLNFFLEETSKNLYFNPSTYRNFFNGNLFNVFQIESDGTNRGFLLFPSRIFLKPISISKNIDNTYNITLSTIILSASHIPIESENFTTESLRLYKNYKHSYENKKEIPISDNLILAYEISGSEKYFKKTILDYALEGNPEQYTIFLDNNLLKIKENSLYISHKNYIYDTNTLIEELAYYNDEDNDYYNFNGLRSSIQSSKKNYEILKNPENINDIWINLNIDPEIGYIIYYAEPSKIEGDIKTPLSLKYISDSTKIKNFDENIFDTILEFKDNDEIKDIFNFYYSNSSGKINLTLKYPPHYYNFNLKFKGLEEEYFPFTIQTFKNVSIQNLINDIKNFIDFATNNKEIYLKYADKVESVDEKEYKSTGIILEDSKIINYQYLIEEFELSAVNKFTFDELYLTLTENINRQGYTFSEETTNIDYLSGYTILNNVLQITGTTIENLTANAFSMGGVYALYSNITSSYETPEYKTNGIILIDNPIIPLFTNTISTYKLFDRNLAQTYLESSNIPTLTSNIYALGYPFSAYAEFTSPLNLYDFYITDGVNLKGNWTFVEQRIVTGSTYNQLTQAMFNLGGIYTNYSGITSRLNLNDIKTTGAIWNGSTYQITLCSYNFVQTQPTTYFTNISTYNNNIYGIYYVKLSSIENVEATINSFYNTITFYNLGFNPYNFFVEGYSFNFDLSSKIIENDTDYVKISTYLFSEYHLATLDLETYGKNDLIKYDFLNVSNLEYNLLSCYYSEDKIPYDILNPTWIPANSGNILYLYYPDTPLGKLEIDIVPNLSTYSGNLEGYYKTNIILAENVSNNLIDENAQIIYINKYFEDYDTMKVELLSNISKDSSDLKDSFIFWVAETEAPNVKMYYYENDEIKYIENGKYLVFDKNTTGNIWISGYENYPITIVAYTQMYNQYAEIQNDLTYFKKFEIDNYNIITKQGLWNNDKIRKIDLHFVSNLEEEISSDFSIYWTWKYGDETNTSEIPISAFKIDGSRYHFGDIDNIKNLSSIYLEIQPEENYISLDYDILIKCNATKESEKIEKHYNFTVDTYPTKNLYDLNFNVRYSEYPDIVIHDTKNHNVLTRPFDENSEYDFYIDVSNFSLLDFIQENQISWAFSDGETIFKTISGSFKSENFKISETPNFKTNYIILSVLNLQLPNWLSAHNFSKILELNSLPEQEFYEPNYFHIYPEFYWTSNSPYLTINDENNKTLDLNFIVYNNKKSKTYNYYVSSYKKFDSYLYSTGDTLTSQFGMLEIPFLPEMLTDEGMTVSLTGYNHYFPRENGLVYKIIRPEGLIDYNLDQICVSQTYPRNLEIFEYSDLFKLSPKLTKYETFNFRFSSILSSINILNEREISIYQIIEPSFSNSPVRPISGSIFYKLSSDYWVAFKDVEPNTGEYNIFNLQIGDPLEILNLSNYKNDLLYLTAKGTIYKNITQETFNNYPEYKKEKDLWEPEMEELIPF